MVKRLEELPEISREVIKVLKTGRSSGLTTSQIKEAIVKDGYGNPSLKNVNEGLGELIEYGTVRGYAIKGGDKKYFLSKFIGSGARNQATLLGKNNPFIDAYKLMKRIFGAALVSFGMGVFVYNGIVLSGAVISTSSLVNENLITPISLIILGGLFFHNSLKR